MRKVHLSLIIVLCLHVSLSSQNWDPFTADEKFHYSNDGNLITNTIHVDSVIGDIEGTTYFFNRIIALCDTCEAENYGLDEFSCPGDSCLYLKDQGQFALKQVLVTPDDHWLFSGNGSFELRPKSDIGSTWDFDGSNTASVISLSEMEYFGEVDSVKSIEISDGREFLLSKNNGLLRYSDPNPEYEIFELFGIQGRDVGELVPEFHDIFNFEVGDVFEYSFEGFIEAFAEAYSGYLKRTITTIESYEDSIVYSYDEVKQRNWTIVYPIENQTSGTSYYSSSNEITLVKADYDFLDKDVNESTEIPNSIIFNETTIGSGGWFESTIFPHVVALPNSDICSYGNHFMVGDEIVDMIENTGTFLYTDSMLNPVVLIGSQLGNYDYFQSTFGSYLSSPSITFEKGLGHTYVDDGDVSWSPASMWMIGYVKDGDTTGTIHSNSYILSIDEVNSLKTVKVFPNPVTNQLYFDWPRLDDSLKSIEVIDMQGRIVISPFAQEVTRGNNSLDVEGLPSGLYMLRLRSADAEYLGRFLKE